MPLDWCICIFDKGDFPIRKVEAVALARPVALLAPGIAFAGVLPLSPLGEFPVKLIIHSIEGAFG